MRSHMIAPLVLIVVGTIFLLNNLGLTDLHLGQLMRTWWPAILIVVGISLLFRRSRRQDN